MSNVREAIKTDLLGTIRRQHAEVERLVKENDYLQMEIHRLQEEVELWKSRCEMDEQERLNRIAAALREACALVEEGSEAHGYIAEALAYADGDLSSFDEEA